MKVAVDKNILKLCKSIGEQPEPLLDWALGYVKQSNTKQVSAILPDWKGPTSDVEIDDSTISQLKKHCSREGDMERLVAFLLVLGLSLGGVE